MKIKSLFRSLLSFLFIVSLFTVNVYSAANLSGNGLLAVTTANNSNCSATFKSSTSNSVTYTMNFPNSYSVTGGISFLVYYGGAWVRPTTITLPATLSNCGGTTLNTTKTNAIYTDDFNKTPYNVVNSTDITVTTTVPVAAFDITITYDSGTNTVTVSGESCGSPAVALAANTVSAANIGQGSINNVVHSF